MPDLFSKISEILSNPEAAQKIREIASTLSSSESAPPVEDFPESASDDLPALPTSGSLDSLNLLSGFSGSGAHSRDLALLHAVRPYLRASRAGKIDNAIKAIRVIDLLAALR